LTVSPSTLRRYRAERLLRQGFGGLREEVLRSVRERLRARGVHLDGSDLEACYAQAWHGLYAVIAAGEEIANPGGWLAVVTFRRAIDEHRGARARGFGSLAQVEPTGSEREVAGAAAGAHIAHIARTEPDLAAELDNRAKLRQLFEALRSRLSARECEAAALCYLQGLTRAQAAQRMGISEARMTKLMEGRGPGSPGVAGKVGELLEAISGGAWCEQQGSLMRGFAFGILDPRGERYRLARLHQRECPACRAYVLSLRGLAAVLPPLPLPWGLGFAGPHHMVPNRTFSTQAPSTQAPSTRASSPRIASARTRPTQAGAGAKAGAGTGAGAITASGAAGAGGAAGGGWLLGGSVGAKLAVGCVLALGVGCVALTVAPHHAVASHRSHPRRFASASLVDAPGAATESPVLAGSTAVGGLISGHSSAKAVLRISPTARAAAVRRAADRHAQREFGLERPASATATASSSPQSLPATAHEASVRQTATGTTESTSASAATPASTPSSPPSRAEREFGPE
jgi:DNA-directed RNA polymerase specialized sigma24 family protein